jgi:hypothetical protein
VEVEIVPEPSDGERAAILAALAEEEADAKRAQPPELLDEA